MIQKQLMQNEVKIPQQLKDASMVHICKNYVSYPTTIAISLSLIYGDKDLSLCPDQLPSPISSVLFLC